MPKSTFFNLPEDKRKRILDVAMDEFASHRYSRASLSNIVVKSGIAKGSMYQYFDDKKDLYTYILDMAAKEKMSYMEQAFNEENDFFIAFERLMAAGARFNLEHPQLAQIIANTINGSGESLLHEIYSKSKEMAIKAFEHMLKEGINKGEIRSDIDPGLAASFVYSLLGQGLADYLLETLGATMHDYLANPEISQKFTPERIEHLVAQIMKIVRSGLEAQKQ
ncbi:TetR/AcrR family transcriptional regulator [Phosphitispora sp. TUW77]|uniref:TetR/AcrR family transcriptional regulator n=1 Tax=Phosphitispora sp. TUW77 TaxID=3152361 RepID=UPI003AB7B15E